MRIPDTEAFSAALLAGGRSRRMGRDKAFLEIGDPPQPLWVRRLALLASLGQAQLLVSHNAGQNFNAPEGVELVPDSLDDRGPLGGLVSCLQRAENHRLLVLAVDLPDVTGEFLGSLLEEESGVVLHDPISDRYEPVVAIYTRGCLSIGADQLQRGDLAMQSFISACVAAGQLAVRALAEHELPLLRNLNRPEDIE